MLRRRQASLGAAHAPRRGFARCRAGQGRASRGPDRRLATRRSSRRRHLRARDALQSVEGARARRVASTSIPAPSFASDAGAALRREQALLGELRAVKDLIEERFGALAFMEKLQRRPAEARLAQKLLDCGFSPMLVRKLAEGFKASNGDETEWAAQILEKNLRTAAAGEAIEERGGVFALVGATGVGKTTTTAKIAAAFAARHGAAQLGLITLDAYRLGAHEQLRAYGRILGVPVHTAHDRASLDDLLELLAGKKMILIDTAGMAQRDTRTRELLDMLSHRSVQRLLVVNAASQGETIEDVLVAYRAPSCAGIVLSKLDEAIKLGPALDAAIRHRLTVVGIANGQRVPGGLASAVGQRARAACDARRRQRRLEARRGRSEPRVRRLAPERTARWRSTAEASSPLQKTCRSLPAKTRPRACAGCSPARRCASFRSSPTRTSRAAASCSSGSAPRSPSAARAFSSSMPARAPAAPARWRWSISPSASSGCRRRSPTSPRAASRSASSMPRARRARSSSAPRKPRRAATSSSSTRARASSAACSRGGHHESFDGADAPCPIVLAEDRPASVTHAYASMKLLAERAGIVVSELLLGAAPSSPRAERIAAKLASCADHFFAGVLRDWARADPAGDPCEPPGDDLCRIVAARFAQDAAVRDFSHTAERHTVRSVAP